MDILGEECDGGWGGVAEWFYMLDACRQGNLNTRRRLKLANGAQRLRHSSLILPRGRYLTRRSVSEQIRKQCEKKLVDIKTNEHSLCINDEDAYTLPTSLSARASHRYSSSILI
ncbi:hypothetical protein J6590_044752 [Homalodisca vitripennis]|nr:hypothetical protein J6590_044752 [Homalodisca vitripennis]